jgi:predicted PurR-regulated permease PerM
MAVPSSVQFGDLQLGARLGAQAQQIGIAALAAATTLAAGAFSFLMDFFIMLVVLFFLLRDSAYFRESLRVISPLSEEQEELFVDRFRTVTPDRAREPRNCSDPGCGERPDFPFTWTP